MLVPVDRKLIWAASMDAGNRSMRKAGRSVWSAADYDVACSEFYRLLALTREGAL